MRIVTFQRANGSTHLGDIARPLGELATSSDRLEAACGKKLLELVECLAVAGPEPQIIGIMMQKELHLLSVGIPKTIIRVWIDALDYVAWGDGLPPFHYRMQVERPGQTLSEDFRAVDVSAAARFVEKVFD